MGLVPEIKMDWIGLDNVAIKSIHIHRNKINFARNAINIMHQNKAKNNLIPSILSRMQLT